MCEVLCVLSGANAEHMDAAVLRTLEDFVWHRLMFVVYSPLLTLRSAFDHGGGSHYSLQSLAEAVTITYGGADYFDHDKRRAYEYAYLLLMCNQPELALDYLALNGHTQHPNGSFDDVIHLALSLHWFSALHVLPFKYSSGAAPVSLFEPLGSTALVLRHVPSGVICVDLYMLLNRYLQLRFTGNVTAYALYLSLLRCLPARLTLLVQLTNAVGKTGYAELFGDAGSGKQGLLHELLRDSSQVTTVLSSAAAQAQREVRFGPVS
jgi:Nup93/Nic96